MTSINRIALPLALMLLCQTGSLAESKPMELRWNELAPLIVGHRVEVILTEGPKVRGEIIAVREDALVLDVTSRVKGYEKGNASLPRTSISLVKVERTRGSWGRTMGTVVGVMSGVVLGSYVVAKTSGPFGAAVPVFLGTASAVSIAGYFTGREIDRRATLIRVMP
jgi:hypothetical protein